MAQAQAASFDIEGSTLFFFFLFFMLVELGVSFYSS
jgi:hypothetical protein